MNYKSESREKALLEARHIFQYAANNMAYVGFRGKAIQDFRFYDGDGQYPDTVLQKLKERDQDPIVINKVKAKINQVSGVEIQSRFRVAYRSHSGKDEDEELAKAITHYSYAYQEQNDVQVKQSQKFRDMLICGVGWSNMYFHHERIWYDYVHPLNIIFDADDLSPQMTEQNYVVRAHWVSQQDAKMLWPKYSKFIEELFYKVETPPIGSMSSEYFSRMSNYIDTNVFGSSSVGGRILVVEVQKKVKRDYYCGIDQNGRYFETFDEKQAIEFTGKESEVEEESGYQILRTVFCRDVVFEHGLLNPNIPNGGFTYVPGIYGRRAIDGIPDGWLTPMKDIQRIINYTKLKEMAMLNSTRAIIDEEAFAGQSMEEVREELSRPDSILIKNKEANISLHPNIDLAQSQINMSMRLDDELQQVSGMFADALGSPTNATSGVAINSRARLSITNQRIGLDHLELMKKREGRLFLDILQTSNMEGIMGTVIGEEDQDIIIMNLARDINGKKEIFYDIRNLPLSIYVEQTHDYESGPEEQRATLEALLGNPNAQMILQSPALMKLIGLRQWKQISEEMTRISQEKMQNENLTENNVVAPMIGKQPGGGPSAANDMGPNPMQIMAPR